MPTRDDLSDVDRSDWAVPIDNRGQGDGGRGSGLIARAPNFVWIRTRHQTKLSVLFWCKPARAADTAAGQTGGGAAYDHAPSRRGGIAAQRERQGAM